MSIHRSSAATSVKQREGTPAQRVDSEAEKAIKRTLPSHSSPTRYAWLTEQALEDDTMSAAVPLPYFSDMLKSSDLPLNSRASLEKLTQSLQAVGSVSSSDRPGGGRSRTSLASSRLAAHKRSLSVQSLASTTSSVDSGRAQCS